MRIAKAPTYRGYEATFTETDLLNAMRSGGRLRWLPPHFFGKPEENGRGLFLNNTRLSVGDEFMVVDLIAVGILWAREQKDGICDCSILESAVAAKKD